MTRAAMLLVLCAMGCDPDTLHYQLRDPQQVTVLVDGQPEPEPKPHDGIVRTGDDTLAETSFTLEHTPAGVYGRWATRLTLAHGELFELVGPDDWIATLPLDAAPRREDGDLHFDLVPHLAHTMSRSAPGYTTRFVAAKNAQPGEHVVTLITPRDNVVQAVQRGDRSRAFLGAALGTWATIVPGSLAAALLSSHSRSSRITGGAIAAIAVGFDVGAVYQIVRGLRHRRLHP